MNASALLTLALNAIAPKDPTKPSPLPAQAAAALRWAVAGSGVWLLDHGFVSRTVESNLVGGVMFLAPLVWSLAQKAAANKMLRAALIAPALVPHSAINLSNLEDTMNFNDALSAFKADVLPGIVQAVEPAAGQALQAGVDALEQAGKEEIAAAEAKLPPALQPLAPTIVGLIDGEADRLREEADAKIASLTSAKAALVA